MRGSRKLALKAALVVTGAVTLGALLCSTEPAFEGRGLRSWLARAETIWFSRNEPTDGANAAQVSRAVRQMGSDGLPVLISMLRSRNGVIKQQAMVLSHLMPGFPIHFTTDAENHARALLGFKILGELASPAVAELTEMVACGEGETAILAAQALARIGPAATNAVPVLVRTLNADDFAVRSVATNALKRIDPLAAVNAGVRIG